MDGVERARGTPYYISSNPDDWPFDLFDDGVLTADPKKALLYQVLYDIIHGVNLPYMEGSLCFPPRITTDSLPNGAVDQAPSSTFWNISQAGDIVMPRRVGKHVSPKMDEEGRMNWRESVDLAGGALPALLLTWLITALLLVVGWLSLVEGLQGSDFVILHTTRCFFRVRALKIGNCLSGA